MVLDGPAISCVLEGTAEQSSSSSSLFASKMLAPSVCNFPGNCRKCWLPGPLLTQIDSSVVVVLIMTLYPAGWLTLDVPFDGLLKPSWWHSPSIIGCSLALMFRWLLLLSLVVWSLGADMGIFAFRFADSADCYPVTSPWSDLWLKTIILMGKGVYFCTWMRNISRRLWMCFWLFFTSRNSIFFTVTLPLGILPSVFDV